MLTCVQLLHFWKRENTIQYCSSKLIKADRKHIVHLLFGVRQITHAVVKLIDANTRRNEYLQIWNFLRCLFSSHLCAFENTSKSPSAKWHLWWYLWFKLRIWLSKWICQSRRKCNQDLFANWAMEWKSHLLYRYSTRIYKSKKKKDEIVSFCILAYCQNMHHRIGSSNVTELIKIKRQFLSVFFYNLFFSDLVYSRITLAGVCIVLVSSFDSLPHHCRSNMANSYSKFLRNSEEIRLTVHCNKPPLKFCNLKA